jgi:hypothetical protein
MGQSEQQIARFCHGHLRHVLGNAGADTRK